MAYISFQKQTSLDPEVLYLLLTAELAGQKGQFNIALEGYLRAARQVNDPRIAERATKIALYRKDYPRAREAVTLWLQQDADSLLARKQAAMLALIEEDKIAAIEHLDYLLEADPAGFEDALFEIVKPIERAGKGDVVYEVLEELTIIHPDQAAIFFVQSILAMQQDEPEQARMKVEKALELQPDWNKALMFQAQIVASSGDMRLAQEILTEAVQKRPENTRLKVLLAKVLIKREKYEDAVAVYRQVIETTPHDLETKYGLALVYLQLEQNDKGRQLFKELVNKPGWGNRVSLHLGRMDAADGEVKRALVWFDKVTQGPFVFDARISSVGLLIDQKRFAEALERLDKLAAETPEQEMRLALIRAEYLSKQKRNLEAFELLTEALKKMPGQKDLLYTRALIAEQLDKLDVLENDLLAILKTHPDDASALNALGYTLVDRTDRFEEAKIYLDKAIALEPDEPVIIDSYGWLKFRQGLPGQALEYLQRAYEQEQESEIAGHLVEVLWSLGRKEEAKSIYRESLAKDPGNEYLLRLNQELDGLARD